MRVGPLPAPQAAPLPADRGTPSLARQGRCAPLTPFSALAPSRMVEADLCGLCG